MNDSNRTNRRTIEYRRAREDRACQSPVRLRVNRSQSDKTEAAACASSHRRVRERAGRLSHSPEPLLAREGTLFILHYTRRHYEGCAVCVSRARVRVRASRYRCIRVVYPGDPDEGGRSRRKKKKTSASWGVVAERVAALRPSGLWRQRDGGETGDAEIPRIARQWEEARWDASEREGDSWRAISLAHDEGVVLERKTSVFRNIADVNCQARLEKSPISSILESLIFPP